MVRVGGGPGGPQPPFQLHFVLFSVLRPDSLNAARFPLSGRGVVDSSRMHHRTYRWLIVSKRQAKTHLDLIFYCNSLFLPQSVCCATRCSLLAL